ncbi:N-acetylmuramoyl-L-alanine amidase [Flavobacterium sp. LMO8]|uniref:N-acetylmuramoyl-L-alanine amidase family protein n=1 Tax=Flavobacterium sp. LMO8 TaxID=2654244 RepID=UPI001290BDD5|nr:N-acetylmuramoyl-L-alanine amidase [Flavobacterium sp. LMO8]MQP24307.1 N-acetylmuramoyl-L-alanine amidase [Flavobacterium sp. LMO8]
MPSKKNTKYLLLLILFFTYSFTFSQNATKFKVVLDAGHGGEDPGALKNGIKEKDVVLHVVLKIGKILEKYKDIEVIYTRKTDIFIGLRERANIANKAKANLFISVHCNGVKSTAARGTETFVMGMSRTDTNLDIAKKENGVIFLEKDYNEKYKGFDPNNPETLLGLKILQEEFLDQSISLASEIEKNFVKDNNRFSRGVKQQPIWVLDATVMPGVLIELGFVTHPVEGKYLNSEKGKEEMSESISNAIVSYKNNYFNGVVAERETVENATPTKADLNFENNNSDNSNKEKSNKTYYKVQISAGTKKLDTKPSNFKGLKNITVEKDKKLYKYFYGEETDLVACTKKLEEAKKKGYTSAYIVTFTN